MQVLIDADGRVAALGPQEFTPAPGQQVVQVNAALTEAVASTATALAEAQAAHEAASRQYEGMRQAVMQAFAQVDALVQTRGGAVAWDVATSKFYLLDSHPQPVPTDDELIAQRAQQDPAFAALLRKMSPPAPAGGR